MVRPEEISSIEEIGMIGDEPVKMIKVIGGFHIATAKIKGADKALAMGSHAAIVKHQLEKTYAAAYRPNMEKSEGNQEPEVSEKTKLLSSSLINNGYTLHVLKSDSDISAIVSHYGIEVIRQNAMLKAESIEVMPNVSFSDANKAKNAVNEKVSQSIVMALAEVAKDNGREKFSYLTSPTTIAVDQIVKK